MNAFATDLVIGIVGTGAMGRGIAQRAAVSGVTVVLYDNLAGAAQNARQSVSDMVHKLASKGQLGDGGSSHRMRTPARG